MGSYVIYSSALTNPDLGLYGQTSTGQVGGKPVAVAQATNPGFWMTDLAVGYAYKTPRWTHLHSVKLKLQLDNVLDRKVLLLSSVSANPASNGYNVLPTRNYFITLSTEF